MDVPSRPRRRWVPVVAGVGILLAFLAIGAVIAIVTVVRETLEVQTVGETEAVAEFEKIKSRFPGRAPLLQITHEGRPRYTGEHQRVPQHAGPIETLHLLAWDPDERKLAAFSLPFWLLRLKPGPIRLSAYASGLDDDSVDLRPEEVEQYGPGILLDHTTPSGERVLFWAQ